MATPVSPRLSLEMPFRPCVPHRDTDRTQEAGGSNPPSSMAYLSHFVTLVFKRHVVSDVVRSSF